MRCEELRVAFVVQTAGSYRKEQGIEHPSGIMWRKETQKGAKKVVDKHVHDTPNQGTCIYVCTPRPIRSTMQGSRRIFAVMPKLGKGHCGKSKWRACCDVKIKGRWRSEDYM